jgi:putative transposase
MSFWRNNYHLVWATKNREPLIQPEFESQLFGYIVNKAAELEVYTHAIGGCADHIHLVVSVPPKHAVAQVIKTLKGASSFYVNHVLRPENLYFAWQRGYGCLTIGEKQRPAARAYVLNQKQHHEEKTTNRWLERCPESDQEPTPSNWTDAAARLVREETATYQVEQADFPF